MSRIARFADAAPFDLAIVGGGIQGLCAAWDAAQRGLHVALVERGDFCGATSFNSLKIVHGGLRSLQHLDVRRMRRSIRDRRALLRIAPHLVRPLPCLMPLRRSLTRGRFALGAAMALTDLIGIDRNAGLSPAQRLPRSRILGPAAARSRFPALAADAVGAALWYDALMVSSERLAMSFLLSARAAGAVAANYVEAVGWLREGNRVRGVRLRDVETGSELALEARVVLNAAGPWAGERVGRALFPLVEAINVVVPGFLRATAVGVDTGARGLRFLVPWQGATLVGTAYRRHRDAPDDRHPHLDAVARLLCDVKKVVDVPELDSHRVLFVHAGLLPAEECEQPIPLGRHRIFDHERLEGVLGLISIATVKYTTARSVAARAVDLVFRKLGRSPPPCRSAQTPLYGGDFEDREALIHEIAGRVGNDRRVAEHIAGQYGSAYGNVLHHTVDAPGLLGNLGPTLRAEVVYAAREELAVHLSDIVFRRTAVGTAGDPGDAVLEDCATIAARELGWRGDRREAELRAVRDRFPA